MIEAHTLTDGGQTALEVAERLAGFLQAAERSLDFALYDFDLEQPTAKIVADEIVEAEQRGVAVRLAFNVDNEKPPPLFPPARGEPSLIDSLEVPTKPIPGVPDLMHHKFAVRDGKTVWMVSTNWTTTPSRAARTSSWSSSPRRSPPRTRRTSSSSGRPARWSRAGSSTRRRSTSAAARSASGSHRATARRSPPASLTGSSGRGSGYGSARRLTSGPILGALAECVSDGKVDITGVVDGTQMSASSTSGS